MSFLYQLKCAFFPERCPYCFKIIECNQIACPDCMRRLDELQRPLIRGVFGYRCVSSFVYAGKVRRMILRVKYNEKIQFLRQSAEVMAKDIRSVYKEYRFDMITSVPMFKTDQEKRGYNQAQLLAKELSEIMEIPYVDTLSKVKRTKRQHELNYQQRKTNLNGAFALIDKDSLKGKSILLIDDIVTTGITLGTCCKVLNRGNPDLLCCATIANANQKLQNTAII